jgi:hypothetical protein
MVKRGGLQQVNTLAIIHILQQMAFSYENFNYVMYGIQGKHHFPRR